MPARISTREAPGRASPRRILRWAYTSNPFYVISADLVFLGLRLSFDTSGRTFETGALMAALLGYTLVLATMACLLIRIGKVWDDTRTMRLRQTVAGLDWIVVGFAFFVIAALISLGKAGLIPRWHERRLRRAFGAGG